MPLRGDTHLPNASSALDDIADIGALGQRLLEGCVAVVIQQLAQAPGKYGGFDEYHACNVRHWRTPYNITVPVAPYLPASRAPPLAVRRPSASGTCQVLGVSAIGYTTADAAQALSKRFQHAIMRHWE